MNDKIKEDIAATLKKADDYLIHHNIDGLKLLSDTTIHNASVFQDKDSIQVAIALYSLSKVLQTKPQLRDQFYTLLVHIRELYTKNQLHSYQKAMDHLLNKIKEVDKNTTDYAKHVVTHAKIKKGSRLYYHGISLGQAASKLGVSQWELYSYIGHSTEEFDGPTSIKWATKKRAYTNLLRKQIDNTIVFDAGPIITSTMNGLLDVLPLLKKALHADFLIPEAVQYELVEKPFKTKKHKLESFRVMPHITSGVLHKVKEKYLRLKTKEYLDLINHAYFAFGNPIQIIHEGEMQALALLKAVGGRTLVVDERTTRFLLEDPTRVKDRLEYKLHTKVHVDEEKVKKFHDEFKHITPIRSAEIMSLAHKLGLFNEMAKSIPDATKKDFYEGLLWGLKLSGCGISQREIEFYLEKGF